MKRALCLWLPRWRLERLVDARPELRRRPLILHAPWRGTQRVATCSHPIATLGVLPGMSVAEATSLVGHLSEPPLLLEHDAVADRIALKELAAWCEQFSPSVGLEEAEQPDSLLLDVTGIGPLFGGEEVLAAQAVRALAQRGFTAQAAIADTIGTAWAVAHYGQELWAVVPAGQNEAALGLLPLAALRLPEETVRLLTELGIAAIEQLLPLPRGALAARFGQTLVDRIDQALGQKSEVVAAHHPPPEIEASWLLEYPTTRQDAIDVMLEKLLGDVTKTLAARQHGVLKLRCRLQCQETEPVELIVGLYRPSALSKHLLELLRLRLERLRLPAPVEAVRLEVLQTAPLESRQQSLFAETTRPDNDRLLAALVDRLSSRLQREAVVQPYLVADAQPEHAFRYRMLTGGTKPARGGKRLPSRRLPGPTWRPLWFSAQAEPLEVVAVAPLGPPVQFRLQSQVHRLARTWGPERIETGWHRGAYARRDYYRVETTTGHRFWIFRRLPDGAWFLQGRYE